MPKLKPLSPNELIKIVEKLGFRFARQKGSHATYANPEGKIVVIPIHSGRKIDRGLLLRIIKKELKMTREEFEKFL
ncbi:MAG: type II toxin-antitoxin system HicA family toxin [Candidatus Diapherotrites archaeon]|nr:type II toxin-antitoxin system HicA family toxin [Candidatus Diapherotrites archaeon]